MEIEKLISALDEVLILLRSSESSNYSAMSIEQITETVEFELARIKISEPVNAELLGVLFAPTGAVQETAIDNGWGEAFLRLSEVVDQFVGRD